MLNYIHVRDYAIVETLELECLDGLTVISGETGAGKSIIVDALGLALGDRADTGVIRQDQARAEIIAGFSVQDNSAARQWLQDNELDDGGECICRRSISREGRSRSWINGSPVPLQQLSQLGDLLIDIHGQHEHQSLLKRDHQRQLLDDYAGHGDLLAEVNQAYYQWQSLNEEHEQYAALAQDRDHQLDLLRFQVQELAALNVSVSELELLSSDHKRLANADRLVDGSQAALQCLDNNEPSLIAELNRISNELTMLQRSDQTLAPIIELINGATIQLDEACAELRHHLDQLDLDPQRLQQIDQRLGAIHDMARKHRVNEQELPALLDSLSQKLDQLEQAEQRLAALRQAIEQAAEVYSERAGALSQQRQQAALSLARLVTNNMQQLGMPDGRLEIALTRGSTFRAHGQDSIEFLVATNPSQTPKPLTRVASGGELSRISLAIQVVNASDSSVPTLIFDEVDVGIGGGVAEIVGHKLSQLGHKRQVLCITHLAQVAAQGHHHLLVSKSRHKQSVTTTISLLKPSQRRQEIARMLGGLKITEQTLAHASEMLAQAENA